MKKVLIVGGAGFIGSFLCKELLKNDCFVVAYDNLMRGKRSNLDDSIKNNLFRFVKGDANDTNHLVKIIKLYEIDHIFHLAANSDIKASSVNPAIEFESTASTTWSILMAMKKTGVNNLFFASTSAVYGESISDNPFLENDVLNPVSYYGAAKMASEAFIKSFSFMNDFNSLIFRFPNVIGPNLTHGVFFDFINALKKDPSKLRVLGDGNQCKPYLHVSDLTKGILQLCWQNVGVNIYNIGPDSSTSVRDIANMVIKEMGIKQCEIIYGEGKSGWKGDVPKFSYSLNKIFKTGWRPSLSSNEAALKTIKEALK